MAIENPNRPERPTKPLKVKRKASIGWCIFWFFIGMLIPIGTLGIVTGVVPVGSILSMFGQQNAVSDNISGQSIISLISGYQNITVKDVPILEKTLTDYLASSNFGKYLTIDWSLLNDLTVSTLTSENIGKALTFNVSLESLEADNLLTLDPKLKTIPCFSEWVEAGTVDPSASDFVPGLYYYDTTEDDGDSTNASYARAFDDNGNYVEGASSTTKLYLVNMYEANLLDCVSVLASRLQEEKAGDLVDALSYNVPENSLIDKLVGERTVGELATITSNDIYLADLISSTTENEQMRNVICSWMENDWENITLYDLMEGNKPITNIKISVLIDKNDPDTNDTLVEIIEGLFVGVTWEEITIGQLMSEEANIDNIPLSVFLKKNSPEHNQEIINIIEAILVDEQGNPLGIDNATLGDLTKGNYSFISVKINDLVKREEADADMIVVLEDLAHRSWEEMTVGDIISSSPDQLLLKSVIPDTTNPIYDVLLDLVNVDGNIVTVDNLTVAYLKSITSFDGLHLITVIPDTTNPIYDILVDLVGGGATAESLTLGDLKGITSFNGFHLISVLEADNPIFPVLIDLVGGGATADSLTIGDLNGITDFGGLHINNLLDDTDANGNPINQDLYGILCDITGRSSSSEIIISDLDNLNSDSFGNIYLYRILPVESNQGLYDVLIDAITVSKTAEEITVADLSSFDMDNVKLTTVIPVTGNEDLYSILRDMTGVSTNDELTIASLSDADPANIKIFDAIDPNSQNVQSSSFLRALARLYPEVTVGTIGTALSDIPLYEVYHEACWTQDFALAASADIYTLTEEVDATTNQTVDVFEYSYTTGTGNLSGDQWYVSTEAGCWIIFCYDITYDTDASVTHPTTEYAETGRPVILRGDTSISMHSMETSSSNTAKKIMETSVYTLIITDLMVDNGYSDTVKSMTIQGMIDYVARYI